MLHSELYFENKNTRMYKVSNFPSISVELENKKPGFKSNLKLWYGRKYIWVIVGQSMALHLVDNTLVTCIKGGNELDTPPPNISKYTHDTKILLNKSGNNFKSHKSSNIPSRSWACCSIACNLSLSSVFSVVRPVVSLYKKTK